MVEQGSIDWFKQRAGKWTGSRFAALLAKSKRDGKPLKAWNDIIWDIVVERLTGAPVDGPDSFALAWGRDVEPFAREAFELETGEIVETCGFIQHPDFQNVGCSPDGLVGNTAILELKCPKNSAVHLQRFLDGVPEEYSPQLQGNMWVTGRKLAYFASYDPRMPDSHRLLVIPVDRDEKVISLIAEAVAEAEENVASILWQLEGTK